LKLTYGLRGGTTCENILRRGMGWHPGHGTNRNSTQHFKGTLFITGATIAWFVEQFGFAFSRTRHQSESEPGC
jgi:hypothetical protein